MVPGHEIAGVVAEVGSQVTKFKVGDQVGVGCFVDSAASVTRAWQEKNNSASRVAAMTYNSKDYDGEVTYGGYSTQIRSNRTTCCAFQRPLP